MPSSALHLRYLRAVYELAHECRDRGDDPLAWREHFCHRLAGLTGAGLVHAGEAAWTERRLRPLRACFWGWENGFIRPVLEQALAEYGSDLKFSPIYRAYCELPPRDFGTCVSRTDVVPDREWDRSLYRELIHSPVGCGHTLMCVLSLSGGGGRVADVSVSREKGERRDFGARHRAVVREAHAAVVPLIGGALARFKEPSPSELPARIRDVLRCLLEGDSDKQVAARLEISRHTVNQYVKVIFNHFGVATRAELVARWVRRGLGNGFAW